MNQIEPQKKNTNYCLLMSSVFIFYTFILGFPGGSAGKESACSVGDLGSIPGLGKLLEKGKATHFNTLAWWIPWTV